MKQKYCKQCKKEIKLRYKVSKQQWAGRLFCNRTCMDSYYVGANYPHNYSLDKNPNWKGYKTDGRGYIYIKQPTHPFANARAYVAEHRLVMEKKIGRFLKPHEVVHHIDQNPSNNLPDNLQLFDGITSHTLHHKELLKENGRKN